MTKICDCCRLQIHNATARDLPELARAKENVADVEKTFSELRAQHEAAGNREKANRIQSEMDSALRSLIVLRREVDKQRAAYLELRASIYRDLLNISVSELEIVQRRLQPYTSPQAIAA